MTARDFEHYRREGGIGSRQERLIEPQVEADPDALKKGKVTTSAEDETVGLAPFG
jgi:hypothetical protein